MRLFRWLDGQWRKKLKPELFRLFPAIIHADTGTCVSHWYKILVYYVCYACFSNSVSSSTPHTRIPHPKTALVRQAVPSVTSAFGTGLWHVQQVSAGCVYTALLIDSLSLSQRKLAGQERQRCALNCVHLVYIRVGVIGLKSVKVSGPVLSSGFIWHHHRPEDWVV